MREQLDAEFTQYLVQGWTPAAHLLAALPAGGFPTHDTRDYFTMHHRGFRFAYSLVRASPEAPATSFDLSQMRPEPVPEPNTVAPTDWVYWRAHVPVHVWTRGGFPQRPHLSPVVPSAPAPHPRDMARVLFDDKGWSPVVRALVENAAPHMTMANYIDEMEPFSLQVQQRDGSFAFCGTNQCGASGERAGEGIPRSALCLSTAWLASKRTVSLSPTPYFSLASAAPPSGLNMSASLAIEDALTLSHSIFEARWPLPHGAEDGWAVYNSLRNLRHQSVYDVAYRQSHMLNGYTGPLANAIFPIDNMLKMKLSRHEFNLVYDHDPLFPFAQLVKDYN